MADRRAGKGPYVRDEGGGKQPILIASERGSADPRALLDSLVDHPCAGHLPRSVSWAIRDLEKLSGEVAYDLASVPTPENRRRIGLLFERNLYDLPNDERPTCHRDNEHTYNSMYGRLRWGAPAQTITGGFGSMGQGRFVHPSRRRTITPHEAARLQTIPDWFSFERVEKRGQLARMIGNVVPPLLGLALGRLVLPELVGERELSAGRRLAAAA